MNMLKGKCKKHKPELLCEGHRRDGVFWFACEAKMAGVDYDYGLSFVKELYHSEEIQLTSGYDFPDSEIEENFRNGYEKAQKAAEKAQKAAENAEKAAAKAATQVEAKPATEEVADDTSAPTKEVAADATADTSNN